jgi:hypothetical protein
LPISLRNLLPPFSGRVGRTRPGAVIGTGKTREGCGDIVDNKEASIREMKTAIRHENKIWPLLLSLACS